MKAVILAGGEGVRLQPLTYIIPKPLLPVGKKPVLEVIINQLKKFGFNDIFLLTGYKSELIKAYFHDGKNFNVNIKYFQEDKKLGTAGPLKALEGQIKEPFLLLNGDILTKANFKNIYKYHLKSKSKITLAYTSHKVDIPFGVIEIKKGAIQNIKEKPKLESSIGTGIYVVSPQVLKYIDKDEYMDLPDLINKLIKNKNKVSAYRINDYWIDLGKVKDFEKAASEAEKWMD